MKQLFIIAVSCLILLSCGGSPEEKAARGVIERTIGDRAKMIDLKLIEKGPDGCDLYSTEVKNGRLRIEGSSSTALCKGFYDWMTTNGYGIVGWSGSRTDIPSTLADMPRKEVRSPFKDRLYYNVCTYGYTTPYWGWEQWEREIDWIALHGFDMPLAPIAGEAILARVWRSLGLTDEEIGEYFTAPGHMPWMRMGNMTELDGPPSQEWHEQQIALQHKINDRMLSLGMKPVYQGFAGFVPRAMKNHYPEINLTEMKWSGFKSWLLSPMDDLFSEIGRKFILEWEKEFGKGKYYLVDSFNEMEIPFGPQGSPERYQMLQKYGQVLYNSIASANPDAVWVMQGWMFGYHRNYWDKESVKALLSGAPDGKLMVIDLAVDFNQFVWRSEKSWDYLDGFHGKEWIFSTVPNFGGRSAVTGALEFYANGHIEALNSPNKGKLTGYGTSPEGVEQNEVVYELISDAAWRSQPVDIHKRLKEYSLARYGSSPEALDAFWDGMLHSAYGTFTNNARFKWQFRPFNQRKPKMGINDHYYSAIESFLSCADQLAGSELYRIDALQYAALYLAGKADILLDAINWAYVRGDSKTAAQYEQQFTTLLGQADYLLEHHPVLRLDRWIDLARGAAGTAAEADTFERDARRLISVWGGPILSDYSARVWSGFIRDFYIPRWQKYFELKKQPAGFDSPAFDEQWVVAKGVSTIEQNKSGDILAQARAMVAQAGTITHEMIKAPANAVSFWSPYEFTKDEIRISTTIDSELLKYVKGIRITGSRGSENVTVSRVTFTADRITRGDSRPGITIGPSRRSATIPVNIEVPEKLPAEVTVNVYLKGKTSADTYAAIELDFGRDRPAIRSVNF